MTTLTTCRDCKFFEGRPPMGLCHRYPPQVVGSFVGTPDPGNPTVVNGRIANDTFWPVVPPTAWCGEFRTNLLIPGNNN